MDLICPVSKNRVNENVVRVNAFFILVVLLTILLTPLKALIFFLILDFAIKVFFRMGSSMIATTSRFVARKLRLKPKMINAGPKVFASRTGLVLTSIIGLSQVIGYTLFSNILLIILIVFVALECFIGFCTACYLLTFWTKFQKAWS